jgi:2-methylisocitrate lyase-like PEP mutase family enzyme
VGPWSHPADVTADIFARLNKIQFIKEGTMCSKIRNTISLIGLTLGFTMLVAALSVIPAEAQKATGAAGWRAVGKENILSAADRRKLLKQLITSRAHITVPGTYDAISARLAEQAGFEVIYCGSYATAASQFGLPDCYLVTWTEMADKVRTIVNATNVPVIADGENGWGYATNMRRVVQALEQAGASAIHIEDGEFGKHTDLPPTYQPMGLMVGKIRAAVNARQDPNFLIIARVDPSDVKDAITRANAYLAAGADVVFPTGMWSGKTLDQMKALRAQINGKVLTTNQSLPSGQRLSSEQEKYVGINVVLHYDLAIAAAYPRVKEAMELLMKTQDVNALSSILSREGFADFIGTPQFVDDYNKYMKPYMK